METALGSSLALDEMLTEYGKEVTTYCPVDIPKYLRYVQGWDRWIRSSTPKPT